MAFVSANASAARWRNIRPVWDEDFEHLILQGVGVTVVTVAVATVVAIGAGRKGARA
jgi:hypothetical protein